ncbi:DUF6088 family protein [Pseudomonas sp. SDO5532_S415]
MSISATISNRIKHMAKGHPFSSERFAEAGSRSAVDKTMSRLVAAGVLERVARGIYMRPKISRYAGRVSPNPTSVLHIIAKHNRETIQVHGAEAARIFNLSTQMQMRPVFYTSGASREVTVGKTIIQLQHVSPEKLQGAGTKVGLALSAMFYLGKDELSKEVVSRIKHKLTDQELKKLLACKMPAWMQAVLRQPV